MPYTSPAKKRTNILVFILEDLFVSIYINTYLYVDSGLPRGHSGKDSACQCRRSKRPGFNPWLGKTPWRRKWQPTPVFLPGKSHGPEKLGGLQSRGSQSQKQLSAHTHTHIQCCQQSNKADKIIPIFQMKEEKTESARCLLFCSRSHHWWVPGC